MTLLRTLTIGVFLFAMMTLSSCDNNDPVEEEVPETITEVTLVFKSADGSLTVSVSAIDPDGEGPRGMEVEYPFHLQKNRKFSLDVLLINGLAAQGTPAYDISAQVAAEGTDHMFFFGWTEGLFSNPAGNGNIDNRADAVNYIGANATDANGMPLGLGTEWTTSNSSGSGEFRVLLKHLPGLKTATSSSSVGETDVDVTFDIVVQ